LGQAPVHVYLPLKIEYKGNASWIHATYDGWINMIHDDMGEWERKIYLTSPIKGKDLKQRGGRYVTCKKMSKERTKFGGFYKRKEKEKLFQTLKEIKH